MSWGREGARASRPRTRSSSGFSAAMTSSGDSTSCTPSRMSRWQPRAMGLWIEPGTANTSRPASAASRAVMRAPDLICASTTRVPSAEPGDDAVAPRELPGVARCPWWVFAHHHAALRDLFHQCGVAWRIRRVDARAEHRDRGRVRHPARRDAPRCRCPPPCRSPRTSPRARRPARRSRAVSKPLGVAVRLPTMAIDGCHRQAMSPRTYSNAGASGRRRSRAG